MGDSQTDLGSSCLHGAFASPSYTMSSSESEPPHDRRPAAAAVVTVRNPYKQTNANTSLKRPRVAMVFEGPNRNEPQLQPQSHPQSLPPYAQEERLLRCMNPVPFGGNSRENNVAVPPPLANGNNVVSGPTVTHKPAALVPPLSLPPSSGVTASPGGRIRNPYARSSVPATARGPGPTPTHQGVGDGSSGTAAVPESGADQAPGLTRGPSPPMQPPQNLQQSAQPTMAATLSDQSHAIDGPLSASAPSGRPQEGSAVAAPPPPDMSSSANAMAVLSSKPVPRPLPVVQSQRPPPLPRPPSWNNASPHPRPSAVANGGTAGAPAAAAATLSAGLQKGVSRPPAPSLAAAPNELPPSLRYDARSLEAPVVDDGHLKSLVERARLSEPLCNGWTLLPHQKRAILFGLRRRRAILALDMGTGKTIVGCVWIRAFLETFRCRAIVLCPVSLREQWRRTARDATGLLVLDCDNTAHEEEDDPHLAGSEPTVTVASWAKVPHHVPGRYVVVADEAHSMQSMASARTRDALQLVGSDHCLGVLLLTGTPLKNGKPLNLFPLLKAVGHPLANCQRSYEAHFCQGHYQSYVAGRNPVWKASGASNLQQLRELTASHVLFLHKDQVLADLPPQTRTIHKVPVSHKSQTQHTQALRDLAAAFHGGRRSGSNGGREGGGGGEDAVLGAIQRVRLMSSLAKTDAAVQLARQVLAREPAVVVFCSFVDACKAIHAQLAAAGWAGELLTGETLPKKRQDMVDRFQNGLSPVFVCTFGAGGVGLTLTAAHTIILVDRPWTPGEARQAEDRVRRIGQTKPVHSLWITAFDLDEQIDALLEQKQQTATAVLQDGSSGDVAGPGKLSIHQLLQRLLPQGTASRGSHVNAAQATPATGLKQTSLLQFSQSQSNVG